MKKIKIMLTAFVVLAVVSGALAFKANRFNNVCYYTDTVSHDGTNGDFCPFRGAGFSTNGTTGTRVYAKTLAKPAGQNCTDQQVSCTLSFSTVAEP